MLKKKDKYNVAVMGATGAVGTQFLWILEERSFPINELRLLASERSRGKELEFKGEKIPVQVLSEDSFKDIDILFGEKTTLSPLTFFRQLGQFRPYLFWVDQYPQSFKDLQGLS